MQTAQGSEPDQRIGGALQCVRSHHARDRDADVLERLRHEGGSAKSLFGPEVSRIVPAGLPARTRTLRSVEDGPQTGYSPILEQPAIPAYSIH